MRKECEEYLKNAFLKAPRPKGAPEPTEEDFNIMPREHLEFMIDLVLGFNTNTVLMDKIMAEYNKKMPDISFGMQVKSLIRSLKV